MSIKSDSTPPPKIGKIGPYTVFITPPPTPNSNNHQPVHSPKIVISGSKPSPVTRPPPVQAPPMQLPNHNSNSSFAFFWDALAKLQNAHASLDEKMAYWFGLDQSKYQWALDDYYESNGTTQKDTDSKVANKV